MTRRPSPRGFSAPSATCKNCRRTIYQCRFLDLSWEPDADPASDPVAWRHANGYAVCPTRFAEPLEEAPARVKEGSG